MTNEEIGPEIEKQMQDEAWATAKSLEEKPLRAFPHECSNDSVLLDEEEVFDRLPPQFRFCCNKCHKMMWSGRKQYVKIES